MTYIEDVRDGVEKDTNNLRILGIEKVTDWFDSTKLSKVSNLFDSTTRGQIGYSPCSLFLTLEITLK